MIQGTEEWHEARAGLVTASRVADVLAKGEGKTRWAYMCHLAAERLSGRPIDTFTSRDMAIGTEREPRARAIYQLTRGVLVDETGFVPHPKIDGFGASPDGLVGNHGLVEIKCPKLATHVHTILTNKIDRKYVLQMQAQMACTGRFWVDYVSYHPDLPDRLALWCKRVERDSMLISDMLIEIRQFLGELQTLVRRLER